MVLQSGRIPALLQHLVDLTPDTVDGSVSNLQIPLSELSLQVAKGTDEPMNVSAKGSVEGSVGTVASELYVAADKCAV